MVKHSQVEGHQICNPDPVKMEAFIFMNSKEASN